MAILAIKGHPTRGKEIIVLLEMLGGKNIHNLTGTKEIWYILSGNTIEHSAYLFDEKEFTLEEFVEKFPYKIGDKVIYEDKRREITKMVWEEQTNTVAYKLDDKIYCNVITELQPYKEETMENKFDLLQQLKNYFDNTPRDIIEKEWHEYDKYNEIGPKIDEYLEYVNNIRQPKYPKTYEGCCEIVGIQYPVIEGKPDGLGAPTYRITEIRPLIYLLICRDAYWKIAGEQMGLGKPWEPDFTNDDEERYGIYTVANKVVKDFCGVGDVNMILTFPTEEIRDAFYENFKDLIEQCKELL